MRDILVAVFSVLVSAVLALGIVIYGFRLQARFSPEEPEPDEEDRPHRRRRRRSHHDPEEAEG